MFPILRFFQFSSTKKPPIHKRHKDDYEPQHEVIIFGNPKIGTPLMLCTQNAGIDLPQKVLITEDSEKKVCFQRTEPLSIIGISY